MKLVKSGTWVASLQLASAIGQLVGIRLLTEHFSPDAFGVAFLSMGVATLLASGLTNPTMQALLKLYPEHQATGHATQVIAAANRQLGLLAMMLTPPVIVAAAWAWHANLVSAWVLALLLPLAMVESYRIQASAVLNARQQHKAHGAWATVDAWSRPAAVMLVLLAMDATAETIVLGYLLGALASALIMRPHVAATAEQARHMAADTSLTLRKAMWAYSLPLLPLGVIGWATGMADRYILSALLGPAQAGLYVAMFSIASRPMLMLGNVIELTVRPAYQAAVAQKDHNAQVRLLKWWTLIVIAAGAFGVLILSWAHRPVASLLLGEQFLSASTLLPWIVLGYLPLLLSHISTRVCYANSDTRAVLRIEVTSGISVLIVTPVMILLFGLSGAAYSLAIVYSIQLTVSLTQARKWTLSDRSRSTA